MGNPFVLSREAALALSSHELAVAQYELLLSAISLFFSLIVFAMIFMFLRWMLPRFYKLKKELD